MPFKDSQYKNDVAFDNAETPAIKDYYVRVPDVDADSIQFNVTLTNPDTTTITASDGTTLTPTKNGDGTYTIKAPLTNKGQTENTITITTKAVYFGTPVEIFLNVKDFVTFGDAI